MQFILFLGLLIVMMISLHYVQKALTKKYNIPKTKGFFYNYVNTQHKVIEISLLLFYLIGTFLLTFRVLEETYLPPTIMGYFPLAFLITLYLIRTFMEWKYERETNRYRLSLTLVAYSLLLILPIIFILERM
ncbi:hypothetical protein CD798_16465 [Bacillaceae bacterium SAOS 7]|nr:hypothetical protein CD798_16465 [Bacillaceae bacterium SAOS 7]